MFSLGYALGATAASSARTLRCVRKRRGNRPPADERRILSRQSAGVNRRWIVHGRVADGFGAAGMRNGILSSGFDFGAIERQSLGRPGPNFDMNNFGFQFQLNFYGSRIVILFHYFGFQNQWDQNY
ncbi:hypothetical protein B0H17DRAFT_1145665 [Mycena rosella]|uniref:Uncharacterized protein n=1 Tax=Mycena rosella TaxID=1033263 RepID=A0AAD7G484_MYCRO|nr:hypothetical protein B0H17DRAFT_1145665 [Mycena rosella]